MSGVLHAGDGDVAQAVHIFLRKKKQFSLAGAISRSAIILLQSLKILNTATRMHDARPGMHNPYLALIAGPTFLRIFPPTARHRRPAMPSTLPHTRFPLTGAPHRTPAPRCRLLPRRGPTAAGGGRPPRAPRAASR
jgi:hypothetical protein